MTSHVTLLCEVNMFDGLQILCRKATVLGSSSGLWLEFVSCEGLMVAGLSSVQWGVICDVTCASLGGWRALLGLFRAVGGASLSFLDARSCSCLR